jgi:hypothetical protein
MRTLLLLATLAAALAPTALAVPITGDGCGGDGGPALGEISIAGSTYVDGRSNGVWVWEESNGLDGLQRVNADSALVPGDAFTCASDVGTPDTLLL